jgi:hypothetical protein
MNAHWRAPAGLHVASARTSAGTRPPAKAPRGAQQVFIGLSASQ